MTPTMVKAKGVTAEVPVVDADRRQAPRVLVDLEVDYASEENYLFAYIMDISETGIFVRTTTPEQPGTRLNLRFRPDDASPQIEIEGVVLVRPTTCTPVWAFASSSSMMKFATACSSWCGALLT
jgi:hypothetical protein